MKGVSLSDLRMELFDTLQKLKSNNDEECSPCEKCTIEEAQTVCDIASAITDTFKVQVQAMGVLARADNPNAVGGFLAANGFMDTKVPPSLTGIEQ